MSPASRARHGSGRARRRMPIDVREEVPVVCTRNPRFRSRIMSSHPLYPLLH